ncbi:TetR family transcriptional regulator [Sediminihabitans luteus]|uniref:TetR family transcriptional regulator n=2 Tax=Sediminihabitans luteus TaxID=1138585 RepID=A0A2M9D0L0_9CELL|nr:TetR family transcriptional regulator [Sediminihabitans luteus]GII98437.1 TetR family transcriptional regulator [Sediminihabitans luteus]
MLWGVGDRATRGPRPSRTAAEVADAALALADAHGLDGLSMRRLAQSLGLGTMSVYTYVQNKDDLVDLVVDRAYAAMYRASHEVPGATWQERLRAVGHENWTLLTEHPWLLDVDLARPVLGPGETRKYDLELGALDGTGLDDVTVDATVTLVVSTAASAARRYREAERLRSDAEQPDDAWWTENEDVLVAIGELSPYERAARVGAAVGEAQAAAWSATTDLEFGIDRVVAGVAAMVDARADVQARASRTS